MSEGKIKAAAYCRYSSNNQREESIEAQLRAIKEFTEKEGYVDSPESIILESVLEGMAEYYSRNLAREVMKGMKKTALQAKHTGGLPPLGYDVDEEGYYVINEQEAVIVKKIFSLYLDGY
ncbi:recombinase family protein [Thermovorax subterraneus]|nr:recombinase family protein [Thermovorax subterraneus]